jgi:hypothetical protein
LIEAVTALILSSEGEGDSAALGADPFIARDKPRASNHEEERKRKREGEFI